MHPSISEQLAGIAGVLTDAIRPQLEDPYPLDVLDGVIAALGTIARSWTELPAYLRWDAQETAVVLARLGIEAPPPPDDPLDLVALDAHHSTVRAMLEASIPAALADPATDAAIVELFRRRIERFPFQQLAPRR